MVVFYFYAKRQFFFPTFLEFGAQIRFPQNRYGDLKSALDQPLQCYLWVKSASNASVFLDLSQSAFTCLKLTIETLEQGMKYVQS